MVCASVLSALLQHSQQFSSWLFLLQLLSAQLLTVAKKVVLINCALDVYQRSAFKVKFCHL